MLTNDMMLELSHAQVWLDQLKPVIGKTQFEKGQQRIQQFSLKGFPNKNWKKLLLASFAKEDTLKIYRRNMQFINLNDARALIDELIIDDLYGLNALTNLKYVVDAGASCGLFSRLVLKKFPDAFVQMIEPNPHNVKALKYNLKPELKSGRAVLQEGALTSSSGHTFIQVPDDLKVWGGLGASGAERDRLNVRKASAVKTRCIDLTTLLNRPVDLLKCDIEGLEFEVLLAVGEKITNCERLLVEIHSDVSDFTNKYAKLISFLASNGFKLTCYEGAKNCASVFSGRPFPSFMLCALRQG